MKFAPAPPELDDDEVDGRKPGKPKKLKRISATLVNLWCPPHSRRRMTRMVNTAIVGMPTMLNIVGHSAIDGANMPANSTLTVTSNDPSVANTDPAQPPFSPLSGDKAQVLVAVQNLAPGTTDFHVTLTAPDGNIFEATATQMVVAAPAPGLVTISANLENVE